ncbi:hypothetical protein SFC55_09235 [Niallia taxi]|uniref:hypothetical protein n=2 Tax=Niallia TaxID=2837506 RepID=UPI003981E284
MDRQRALFYGFIIGVVLLITPVPHVLYWMDDNEEVFRYFGLFISVICAVPLIFDVARVYKNILKKYS